MPDQPAFLRVICENPDDDGPRLVYADWLEEQGNPRGEFIRLQIERSRLPLADREGRQRLTQRADELNRLHAADWQRELPRLPNVTWGDYHRGMIQTVVIQGAATFVEHGQAICEAAPIRRLWFRELGAEGARRIAESPALARMHVLHVGDNAIGDDGVEALVTSKHLAGLKNLFAGGNNLTATAARQIARSKNLTNLTLLFLSNNQLGDEGAEALAESKRLPYVEDVYVAANGIHESGTTALRRRWGVHAFV